MAKPKLFRWIPRFSKCIYNRILDSPTCRVADDFILICVACGGLTRNKKRV